jgi:2-desacetyl-2-hydroxyethyl bacteriochlorophyllide A dehydrogenase
MSVLAQQLWFTAPQQVEVREQQLSAPAAGEVLVQTLCSAISAGTELLVYRGQLPADISLDATLVNLQQSTAYPLQYGYASVGRVVALGREVDASWRDALVFAFQPHASHFLTTPANLIRVPDGIEPEAALFLANMETAVNLVQDGQPAIGEKVVVLGQGIVGVLLLQLLQQFPLAQLAAVDALADRRQRALAIGANTVADPTAVAELQHALFNNGADLVYEVSGVPTALNLAITLSGYASRIVIGSWYGNKSAAIELGGAAHRNRLQLITSQVSTLAPALSGRWDKQRRFDVAWQMIRQLNPQQWITQRAALTDASTLYQQIHNGRADLLQAVFTYPT